jgi:hypothetical protein
MIWIMPAERLAPGAICAHEPYPSRDYLIKAGRPLTCAEKHLPSFERAIDSGSSKGL